MFHYEMTIDEVLEDPLIRQMMRADQVSLSEMKKLLLDAAGAQNIQKQAHRVLENATAFRAFAA